MCRHPGEGRGPASDAQSWIPAFAGMTAVGEARKIRFTMSISRRHVEDYLNIPRTKVNKNF